MKTVKLLVLCAGFTALTLGCDKTQPTANPGEAEADAAGTGAYPEEEGAGAFAADEEGTAAAPVGGTGLEADPEAGGMGDMGGTGTE